MNRLTWQIILGIVLLAASAALYVAQIAIFHNTRDTLFYLLQDLAFIPVQVLLVTLILNQMLNVREKLAMLNKLNMVIGTFFSEVGSPLLRLFAAFDGQGDSIRGELLVNAEWSDNRFTAAIKTMKGLDHQVKLDRGDLAKLKSLLMEKRAFLLSLLENPNLLEHETFTDLLWAVFHLTEELSVREYPAHLEAVDADHIAGDIQRAYVVLVVEWLTYMKHLKHEYPYLFSFAVRTNPFDPAASPAVK